MKSAAALADIRNKFKDFIEEYKIKEEIKEELKDEDMFKQGVDFL